jgi:hypothetical protein
MDKNKGYYDGFVAGVKLATHDLILKIVDVSTFAPTINEIDFDDQYQLGYELGYIRTLLEEQGYEIGKQYVKPFTLLELPHANKVL